MPNGRAPAPRGRAGRRAPGVRRLALSLPWAGPSGAGMSGPWARTTCPASAAGGSGHVIRAHAWHCSMPCPDFRGACPALPWTAWPAYSLPSWLHGAEASTMRDHPASSPAPPASPCGGAADGTLLPAEPPACLFRRPGCPLLACLAPAPALIPTHGAEPALADVCTMASFEASGPSSDATGSARHRYSVPAGRGKRPPWPRAVHALSMVPETGAPRMAPRPVAHPAAPSRARHPERTDAGAETGAQQPAQAMMRPQRRPGARRMHCRPSPLAPMRRHGQALLEALGSPPAHGAPARTHTRPVRHPVHGTPSASSPSIRAPQAGDQPMAPARPAETAPWRRWTGGHGCGLAMPAGHDALVLAHAETAAPPGGVLGPVT